ncbi:MAG: type VI secretion system membrane subunit TssM [Planctomycetes bacterium]|nr:type VI secretion system membrane subunit TssM [Planctomycetota bacterium]
MLRKLLMVLTRPPVPLVLGTLVAIVSVWFGGGLMRDAWGWPSALWTSVLCALIAVGAGVGVWLKTWKAGRQSAAIENEIRAQARVQLQDVRPDRQGDIAELQQRFDEALAALRSSKLGKGALYALPWYVIIGPPGSGKTTAITESGLNFPTFKGAQHKRGVRGLGGTRNCDWWFTDAAILLDTAGRYTTEAEDRDEWLSFLGMIKKARKHKPINGVMIAISIVDILTATEPELEKHAETIRQRIDELVKQLEVVFPVYLVFTKCDLLDGFTEFFGAMSKEGRGQVFGATFPAGAAAAMHDRFTVELDLLLSQLAQERNRLLVADRPLRQQGKVFSLPMQLRACRHQLREFVRLLTQANPYSEASELRGFYLTSGTQEGAPIDRVLENMSKAYGLQPQPDAPDRSPVEAKSYFIRDLFAKVMFADRELARSSAAVVRREDLLRRAAIVGSALVLVAAGVMSTMTWVNTRSLLGTAADKILAAKAAAIAPERTEAPPPTAMAALDELRDACLALRDAYSATSVLGPSRSGLDHAMTAYAAGVRAAFLLPTKAFLDQQLQQYVDAAVVDEDLARPRSMARVYAALHGDFVAPEELQRAIEHLNAWKWAPKDLGKPGDVDANASDSRHLRAWTAAERTAAWSVPTNRQLLARAEQRLQGADTRKVAIRKILTEVHDSKPEASLPSAVRSAKEELQKDLPQVTEEAITAEAIEMELERLAALPFPSQDLDQVMAALPDLDSDTSARVVGCRALLERLRQAGRIPAVADDEDALLKGYRDTLRAIASLRDVLAELRQPVAGTTMVEQVAARRARVDELRKKHDEVAKIHDRNDAQMRKVTTFAIDPTMHSLIRIREGVLDGVAAWLRNEFTRQWQERVGTRLATALAAFPFAANAAAADLPLAELKALFGDKGLLADAFSAMDDLAKYPLLGGRLEPGDVLLTLRNRVRTIAGLLFANGPEPVIGFKCVELERAADVDELSLVVSTATKIVSSTSASARTAPRKWQFEPGAALLAVMTFKEDDQHVTLRVPSGADSIGKSPWGFLRLLRLAKPPARVQDNGRETERLRFTWAIEHKRKGETAPRTYECSAELAADGARTAAESPFDPGFFQLVAPAHLFAAEKAQ